MSPGGLSRGTQSAARGTLTEYRFVPRAARCFAAGLVAAARDGAGGYPWLT